MSVTNRLCIALLGLVCSPIAFAQQTQPTTSTVTSVPRLVRINSAFHPANGGATAPVESVTFSVYSQETGGDALWQETQNVAVDSEGRYSVLLGSTRNEGLPQELFAAGEPRWLGVQFQRPGETEQRRVLLASVPYALKAADADTLGGRPASAYLLNPAVDATASTTDTTAVSTSLAAPNTKATKIAPRFTSSGTAGSLALFTNNAGDIGNSALMQSGLRIGLGTAAPADVFHVAFNDPNGGITGIAVQNFAGTATSYSGMLFYDQNGSLGQFQGFNNSTHEYRINNIATNGSVNFMIGSSSKFFVSHNGNIGVGTSAPAEVLDVAGNIHTSGGIIFPDNTKQITAASPSWFNVFLEGPLTSLWTGGHIILDQPIAVKRVTIDLKSAGSSCGQTTIRVGNGTIGQNIVIPTGVSSYDSGPEVIPFASGGAVIVGVAQASSCTGMFSPPSSANVEVQYYPVSGAVTTTCASGDQVCNNFCTSVLQDSNNCGGCAHSCSNNNGVGACSFGTCTITCNAGFANCDGNVSNGCEVNLLTSPGNCGNCGSACPTGHACVNGMCQ